MRVGPLPLRLTLAVLLCWAFTGAATCLAQIPDGVDGSQPAGVNESVESGDVAYEGVAANSERDDIPVPVFTSITPPPEEICLGESFTISYSVKNSGGTSDDGAISVSFPEFTGGSDHVHVTPSAGWGGGGDTPGYIYADAGDGIYDSDCDPMTAQYLLVEYADDWWRNGGIETNTSELEITPQELGLFRVLVRSTMHRNYGGFCEYYNEIPGGSFTSVDQQGWQVTKYYVDVVECVNVPPTIEILVGPSGVIDYYDVEFCWLGHDSDGYVQGYEYEMDGVGNATGETCMTFNGLAEGPHMFRVRCFDNDGAYSDWANRSFTVVLEHEPNPEFVVNPQPPASVPPGETCTIAMSVRNSGGDSDDGGIVVSFPSFTASGDHVFVSKTGGSSGDSPGYLEIPGGNAIYDSSCNPMVAQYLLVEYADNSWHETETNSLEIEVITPTSFTEFWIYVRATMHDPLGGTCAYVNGVPSNGQSGHVDQQGWPVSAYLITPGSPVEDLTWGAIKALFR